ncbi:MAG TPA: alkaline phosphatase family protein [Jatrophihabitans sp.]|nr:alkaline phosphatase family protein [Jatrophihabitans sp.]
MSPVLSRRAFLALSGVALTAGCTIDHAFRVDPAGTGSLADIDHFVLLMQENRSFDQYFGMRPGVHGLAEPAARTAIRRNLRSPHGLRPFHLNATGDVRPDLLLVDPAHSWSAQHQAWNGGALDRWMAVHDRDDGPEQARVVMGYYTRADLPAHYGLADAFTLCDQYFCSVLGPTGTNRLHWMSGTLDPDGANGGPIVGAAERLPRGSLTWTTFPERLQDAGVSWKVYNHLPPQTRCELTGMLKYFRNYQDPQSVLYQRGLAPAWPRDFIRDVRENKLPAVSWIIPSYPESEHPNWPPPAGAETIMRILTALVANPRIWEKTVFIVSYDENGGFFDHVPPPTPPVGTAGEYVRQLPALGPIGLGFRVPCLVISPYSRGGYVSSQVFDHTSQLRLIGRRFGVEVPNLSAWRRAVTGDMASLLHSRGPAGSRLSLPNNETVARLSNDALAERNRAQRRADS